MKTRAALTWKAGAPLTIETVDLQGPRAGEVLVKVNATGICHTGHYMLSGANPEGLFPAILGHESAGVVMEVGPGVTSRTGNSNALFSPKPRARHPLCGPWVRQRPLKAGHQPPMPALRTGTDNLPLLNHVAQPGPSVQALQQHSQEGLSTPGVWRSARSQAAAKVDALLSNGMDAIEIPVFLRKQAD